MPSNILICDDQASRVEQWRALIAGRFPDASVIPVTGADLADLVKALSVREEQSRAGESAQHRDPVLVKADRADLVILDSDLSPAPGEMSDLDTPTRGSIFATLRNGYGDDVARQLRTYTSAGLLVVVNMFWSRHARKQVFDLTLRQAAATYADVHINAADLRDPLWWGDPPAANGTSYNPWGRPTFSEAFSTYRRSLECSIDAKDKILESFGLDSSRLTAAQLDPFVVPADNLTFSDLAFSRLGFKYVDDGIGYSDEATDRMTRSVIRRWLQRVVVPAQNVLVDLPHLLERYWDVTAAVAPSVNDLNNYIRSGWDTSFGVLESARNLSVRPFVDRPVFDDAKIRRVAATVRTEQGTAQALDVAFAEDTSSFVQLEDVSSFPSDVAGPQSRRHVFVVDNIGYEPANRLLL